jgi:DNA-binding transcriptional regulator PaaX
MDFKKKYPLSAREAAYTPMILRDSFGTDNPLPYPSLGGIRDFTNYCGIKDGAVRTTLSRARAEGEINVFKDAGKVTRYRLAESMMEMGKATINRQDQPEGFIIAVFSFTKHEETERAKVRETLKYYGFKKLAQNTYINGRIDTSGLKKAMREYGLEKNLYLFECPHVDDTELIEKILAVFEIEKREKFLREFYNDLASFLAGKNQSTEEVIHRIYYAGPVHWTICNIDEPPFPVKHLPPNYPLEEIKQLYVDVSHTHMKHFIEHYLRVNG